jgi:integrase
MASRPVHRDEETHSPTVSQPARFLQRNGSGWRPCQRVDGPDTPRTDDGMSAHPKFLLLADIGMRFGELAHLMWKDVDFEKNVLRIRPKEGWRPKTGDQRAVPMSRRERKLLQSLPWQHRWVVTAAPSKKYPAGGNQISERRLPTSLKHVLGRLGLEGHLNTFRHSFVSNTLTEGTPVPVVQDWVGHLDPAILKVYTHIADASSQAKMLDLMCADDEFQTQDQGDLEPSGPDFSSAQSQHSERSDQNG